MPKQTEEKFLVDIALVVITTKENVPVSYAVQTTNKASSKVVTEETKGTKLVVKGKLKAQKRDKKVITGLEVTLEDTSFQPELVRILQGGTLEVDDSGEFVKYTAPIAGEEETSVDFDTDIYIANYDEAGNILCYDKLSMPNCKGQPIDLEFEDDKFFAPKYPITSAPAKGQAPYTIEKVTELPAVDHSLPSNASTLFANAKSVAGGASVTLASAPKAGETVWFAPDATVVGNLTEGATMTKLVGNGSGKAILAPTTAGKYKLYVVIGNTIRSTSTAELTVTA